MLLLGLKISIAVLLFATGMSATVNDVTWLWRRPVLLGKSVLAMYVVAPLVAVLMARTLDLPRPTEVALVVLAICAGAPLLPRKLLKLGGDAPYVFSLVVTTSLLAIVTVPASLHALARYLSFDPTMMPGAVAGAILKTFLLPLVAGMLVRAVAPALAGRIDDILLKVASLVMLACALVLIVAAWRQVLTLGWPSFLAFVGFTLAAILAGHLLGGPDPEDRTTLGVTSATRHIGLALLIAAGAKSPHTLSLVAGYLFASALVSIPYIRWRTSVHARAEEASPES
jgi:BASS family bile acid:Na+ symporter